MRHLGALHGACVLEQACGDSLHSSLNATLDVGGCRAAGDIAQALVDQCLCEHGCSGGTVTGYVVGLGGDFLRQLGAQVLVRVVQFNFAGNGHAVIGDDGCAPLLVEHNVAPARPRVTLTAFASLSTPACRDLRAASLNSSCLAMCSLLLVRHRKENLRGR